MNELWIYFGALAVACLLPGPDMMLMLDTGARSGRSATVATALGLATARSCHLLLSALGVAALMRTWPWLFDLVRVVGALYLAWLGIQVLRHGAGEARATAAVGASSHLAAFRRGLLTNLLNPKALLFCSVLLPQFVHPEQGGVAARLILLGAILLAVGVVSDLFYGLAGRGAGQWMRARPAARRIQNGVFASVLMLFGVRLLLSARPT